MHTAAIVLVLPTKAAKSVVLVTTVRLSVEEIYLRRAPSPCPQAQKIWAEVQ